MGSQTQTTNSTRMAHLTILFILTTAVQLSVGGKTEVRNSAGPKCKTPNGNIYSYGETVVKGCSKYVCNGLKWSVVSTSMCCTYQRRKVPTGEVIDSIKSEDGCTSALVKCVPNGNRARIDLRIKSDCPRPASEDTLVQYMEELKELIEKQSNETAGVTTVPTTTTAPVCDGGWSYVEGNCYSVQTVNLTWEAARNNCLDLGGDLASVGSSAVQAKLYDLQSEVDFWLGANDLSSDTTFSWINGDSWVYDNWNTNQPNHKSGQDCVKMKKNIGRWDDVACTGEFMFACQKAHVGTYSFGGPGGLGQSSV